MKNDLQLRMYQLASSEVSHISGWPETVLGYKLVVYKPTIFSFPKHGISYIRNLFNIISSRGQFTMLLLYDGNVLVHYVGIIRKTFRFPYMKKNDLLHQQAFTNPAYRGKGILTEILKLIPSVYKNEFDILWSYCDLENYPSHKALERTGYKFIGFGRMNWNTRIIKMVN
jgi:RimJ/RimL family protein N-acetyltransferase